jgi:hypothetical protein
LIKAKAPESSLETSLTPGKTGPKIRPYETTNED